MITTKEILEYMESGQTFSMRVIAYDRKRKTGGAIKEYPEAILVQKEQQAASRPATKLEAKAEELRQLKKNPHHKKWYSRNIRVLQNGHPTSIIHTVHPPIIVEFNGDKEVIP